MRLTSGGQATLLWAALGFMLIDHVGLLLFPEVVGLRLVGRAAFPLFAGLIAYNLSVRLVPVRRYLPRLAVFAAISQLPFALIAGPLQLNIFVTLLLGVVVWGVIQGQLQARWLLLVPVGVLADYGLLGLALVPVAALALSGGRWRLLWGAGALVLVAGAQAVPAWAVTALAWSVVVLAVVKWARLPELPRPARWLAYAFYPGHLVVLLLLGVLRGGEM